MSAGAARGRGGGQEGGGVARAVHLPVVAGEQGLRRLQPATTIITTTITKQHKNTDKEGNVKFEKYT
jgi:hypothetical protein